MSGSVARAEGTYQYPDGNDQIPRADLVSTHVTGELDWDAADHALIKDAAAQLSGGRASRAADIGTGRGRLLPVLLQVADAVTAVEPDPARLAAARQLASAHGGVRCRFVCADLDTADFSTDPYDLVVCAHVVQHLATDVRASFAARLREITAPDGLLMLMFCGTGGSPERYLLSTLTRPGHAYTREVGPAEFDEAVRRLDAGEPDAARLGISGPDGRPLPVWQAGAGDIERLLRQAGLVPRDQVRYREFTFRAHTNDRPGRMLRAADFCVVACPDPRLPG